MTLQSMPFVLLWLLPLLLPMLLPCMVEMRKVEA